MTGERRGGNTLIRKLLPVLAVLFALAVLCTAPVGAVDGVRYSDTDGTQKTVDGVTEVTSDLTAWTEGWYVVNRDVTISERIIVSGDVKLILMDYLTLTAEKGIDVSDDDVNAGNGSANKLTIYGQVVGSGKLIAKGIDQTAGIGGGDRKDGGEITINGGVIEATGGKHGAGIGGGNYGDEYVGSSQVSDSGTITINGGRITATGGHGGAGIGGGYGGSGDVITITKGTINAFGGEYGAGIGGGWCGGSGTITISDGIVYAAGGGYGTGIGGGFYGGQYGGAGTTTINGGIVTAVAGYNTFNGGGCAGIGDSCIGYWNKFSTGTNGHAAITALGGKNALGISDQSYRTAYGTQGLIIEGTEEGTVYGTYTLPERTEMTPETTLTIATGGNLIIPSGTTLVNKGTIILSPNSIITNNGDITGNGVIDASKGGQIVGSVDCKVQYAVTNKLTNLISDGAATANNKEDYVAVLSATQGYVLPDSVTVKIGNGEYSSHGYLKTSPTITIPKADITSNIEIIATAEAAAANSNALIVSGGTLDTDYTYNGNTVTILTGTELTIFGSTTSDTIVVAENVEANITLYGVTIDASGSQYKSAISLKNRATANITLMGANTVKSGYNSAGIWVPYGTNLTITETSTGSLYAVGGNNGAGIGGGFGINLETGGNSGNITIKAGTVEAIGGFAAAGIGGGSGADGAGNGSSCSILITGGTVTATGDTGAAGIGGGFGGEGGAITISGGTITATGNLGSGIGSGFSSGSTTTTFSTGTNGNAFIDATGGISGKTGSLCGIIFDGSDGEVYGAQTITTDTLISGKTLTIKSGSSLRVKSGSVLTVKGSTVTGEGAFIITEGSTLMVEAGHITISDVTLSDDGGIIFREYDSTSILSGNVNLQVPSSITIDRGVTLTNMAAISGDGIIYNNGNLLNSGTISAMVYGKSVGQQTSTQANPPNPINPGQTTGGTVTADIWMAEAGETVTITATPDNGYKVGTITVTADDGSAVTVTQTGNTATFVMPNCAVTINAAFTLIQSESSEPSGSSVWLTETPTPIPTETVTPTPSETVPTDIPTSTVPTKTPKSPGFGVLAVLAGLGAVVVMRRR